MRDEQSRFQERGVRTFGVNPASVADHEKYVAKFHFNFPLLSDAGRAADAPAGAGMLILPARAGRSWTDPVA